MKIIIAGSRDMIPNSTHWKLLNDLNERLGITEVVSGKARGADTFGEEWAKANGIPVKDFPADWDTYDRAAGPIRNKQMSDYADGLIAFLYPDSRGTKNMIDTTIKNKKSGKNIKHITVVKC